MPKTETEKKEKAFEVTGIFEKDQRVTIELNPDMADAVGHTLAKNSNDNPAVFALGMQLKNSVKVLDGRKQVSDFEQFAEVDTDDTL